MDENIAAFLASSPVFSELPADQLEQIASLFRVEKYSAGTVVMRQGERSETVYFIRSGEMAVRIQRGNWRETIAYLKPPEIFGELSFVTGRPSVADMEVLVDAELLLLHREMVPKLPEHREAILRSLMRVIAGRLQDTVSRGSKLRETPVVLLLPSRGWEAPRSFPWELSLSLARQTGRKTLLTVIGGTQQEAIREISPGFAKTRIPGGISGESGRSELARRLTEWKSEFDNVLLVLEENQELADSIGQFATWTGHLLGPGENVPSGQATQRFVVQSAIRPMLPFLSGSQQLIFDASVSESEHLADRPATPRFRRTVDSIARCIAESQVGLALGGGAAWGWAHIGVLSVLEEAGLPIDVVTGCSMGSVIGAFYSAGFSVEDLKRIADTYRHRTRRFIEWRLWKMCLINEKKVRKTFHQFFGDQEVNQTQVPFWANAVDIRTGKEYTIKDGSLVECVRSSIALPGLLSPAARRSHLLVDAGIMDPVPVLPLRNMGCHFAIGINAMAKLESQEVSNRYPFNALDVLTRSMFLMGHEIGQARAEQAADIVFTPELGNITMLQFSRSPEIIECGRRATEERLPGILAAYERLKNGDYHRATDPFKAVEQN
jgi:NTE family protein